MTSKKPTGANQPAFLCLESSKKDGTFPQGDEQGKPFSIFSLRISEDRRNHYGSTLRWFPIKFNLLW